MSLKTLVEKLVEIRTKKDWSQFDLAKELNCHPQTISSWERGEKEPAHYYRAAIERLYAELSKVDGRASLKLEE